MGQFLWVSDRPALAAFQPAVVFAHLFVVAVSVPRQLYLPVLLPHSVLPVHLLGLASLLGSVGAVAGHIKLQDDGVMDHPVNRRRGGHGVGEDALLLREDQV